jgi:hypothetical protein
VNQATPRTAESSTNVGLHLRRIVFLTILNGLVILQFIPKEGSTKILLSRESVSRASPVPEKALLTIAPDLEVLEANLYAVDSSITSNPKFTQTDVIRMAPNISYGWAIRLRTGRKQVHFNEELRMPVAPTHWGLSKTTKISDNGRVATTSKEYEPRKGIISNFWKFSDGDPKGTYQIAISVEGVLVRRFKFSVQ